MWNGHLLPVDGSRRETNSHSTAVLASDSGTDTDVRDAEEAKGAFTTNAFPNSPFPCDAQGHFEFFLCDISDMDDPDGVVTQECLNRYPLDRAPEAAGANSSSPIDPDYPGRYYVDPPCRKTEVEQTVSSNMPESSYNVKMPYLLPDIECEHCVLQMHYREFTFTSFMYLGATCSGPTYP